MTDSSDKYSNHRCERGMKVAKHQARLQREDQRPCEIVGMVDAVKYEPKKDGFELKYRERTQLRTDRFFCN